MLQAELVEENGSWFFAPLRARAATANLSQFPDRTGLECFVNHIHIGDFTPGGTEVNVLHRQGLLFANELSAKLQPHGSFAVIVSCDETDCSVRFHASRPGERWFLEDLETYEEEALLVFYV